MNRLTACLAAGLLATLPLAATAQVNPAFSDLDAAVSDARAVIQTERRLLVSQALELGQAEGAAFWPLYDKYAADLKAANDLRVKVVTDYAAAYPNVSDAVASQLLKDGLAFQDKLVKVRKSYLRKFTKAIGPAKTARFYQLENKIDAIAAFALARQIPLIEGGAPSAPLAAPAGR